MAPENHPHIFPHLLLSPCNTDSACEPAFPPERKNPFRDNGWDRRRLRGPGLCRQHPWGPADGGGGGAGVLVEAGVGAAGAVSPLAALHHAGDLQAGHHRKTAVPHLRGERESAIVTQNVARKPPPPRFPLHVCSASSDVGRRGWGTESERCFCSP